MSREQAHLITALSERDRWKHVAADALRIGDAMQSEADRLLCAVDERTLEYEERMAYHALVGLINEWTEMRRTMGRSETT